MLKQLRDDVRKEHAKGDAEQRAGASGRVMGVEEVEEELRSDADADRVDCPREVLQRVIEKHTLPEADQEIVRGGERVVWIEEIEGDAETDGKEQRRTGGELWHSAVVSEVVRTGGIAETCRVTASKITQPARKHKAQEEEHESETRRKGGGDEGQEQGGGALLMSTSAQC